MNLEQKLKGYQASIQITPREQNIKETIKKSMEVYYFAESERLLTYHEFLWEELRLIQKKWWLLQSMLLFALWAALPSLQEELPAQRFLGAAASLFIILIIPEFWKSQTYQSMEIESVSYYSLRQIYSARMLLFGIVDTVLLSLFCWLSLSVWEITFSQILVQFIFPMTVTACICFGILCSNRLVSETAAIMACIGWSSIWLFVILDERIYAAVTYPVWFVLLGFALLFMAFAIYRMLRCHNNYWEENL